jgi:hypothetical protein
MGGLGAGKGCVYTSHIHRYRAQTFWTETSDCSSRPSGTRAITVSDLEFWKGDEAEHIVSTAAFLLRGTTGGCCSSSGSQIPETRDLSVLLPSTSCTTPRNRDIGHFQPSFWETSHDEIGFRVLETGHIVMSQLLLLRKWWGVVVVVLEDKYPRHGIYISHIYRYRAQPLRTRHQTVPAVLLNTGHSCVRRRVLETTQRITGQNTLCVPRLFCCENDGRM